MLPLCPLPDTDGNYPLVSSSGSNLFLGAVNFAVCWPADVTLRGILRRLLALPCHAALTVFVAKPFKLVQRVQRVLALDAQRKRAWSAEAADCRRGPSDGEGTVDAMAQPRTDAKGKNP
jgi:hypothetical protein